MLKPTIVGNLTPTLVKSGSIVNLTAQTDPETVKVTAQLLGDNITLIKQADGTWKATYTIPTTTDGKHTVYFIAEDTGGNQGTDCQTFTMDNTPPTISGSLTPNGLYAGENIDMDAYTSQDAKTVTASFGSEQKSLNNAAYIWSGGYTPPPQTGAGEYQMNLHASDALGNTATMTLPYTIFLSNNPGTPNNPNTNPGIGTNNGNPTVNAATTTTSIGGSGTGSGNSGSSGSGSSSTGGSTGTGSGSGTNNGGSNGGNNGNGLGPGNEDGGSDDGGSGENSPDDGFDIPWDTILLILGIILLVIGILMVLGFFFPPLGAFLIAVGIMIFRIIITLGLLLLRFMRILIRFLKKPISPKYKSWYDIFDETTSLATLRGFTINALSQSLSALIGGIFSLDFILGAILMILGIIAAIFSPFSVFAAIIMTISIIMIFKLLIDILINETNRK